MSQENAVSIKLPIFWSSEAHVQFSQAEAQFNVRGITADDTRYYYLLSALDQTTATLLLDLIQRPPTENKYTALKDHLLDTFGLTERERASQLLRFRPLGDSKPSSLMDEMLALLGDHRPCLLFQQLFLQRLPEDIRIQLADAKFEDVRQLVREADALWAARDMGISTNAIQRRQPVKKRAETRSNTTAGKCCYYHRTFGDSARQCREPCTWQGNDQAGCL